MEIKVKKTEDGNPICDMDEILTQAKQKLNGSVVTGLRWTQETVGNEIIFKFEAE